MSNSEDSDYKGNEQNLRSQEKDTRANELETIGNTGGTSMLASARTRRSRVANPDDPIVQRPPRGLHGGPWPGPNYVGLQGRTAIVQGQVFLVAIILIIQLWLVTDALYELLSGRTSLLAWLALASAIGFILALIISFWPRHRIEGS
jgi:hypothetical protein